MIAAVTATKAPTPVNVRFAMSERPQPGQPLEVDVALIPVDPAVVRVSAKFDGEDGLVLVKGREAPAVDKPAPRVPIMHTVTIMPNADGIYALMATVTAATDADSKTVVFAIPVIAGKGLPELAAKSDTGAKHPPTP